MHCRTRQTATITLLLALSLFDCEGKHRDFGAGHARMLVDRRAAAPSHRARAMVATSQRQRAIAGTTQPVRAMLGTSQRGRAMAEPRWVAMRVKRTRPEVLGRASNPSAQRRRIVQKRRPPACPCPALMAYAARHRLGNTRLARVARATRRASASHPAVVRSNSTATKLASIAAGAAPRAPMAKVARRVSTARAACAPIENAYLPAARMGSRTVLRRTSTAVARAAASAHSAAAAPACPIARSRRAINQNQFVVCSRRARAPNPQRAAFATIRTSIHRA